MGARRALQFHPAPVAARREQTIMDGSLDGVGGSAPIGAARGASSADSASMQQLGQFVRLLTDEFAAFSAPGQVSQLWTTIRQLSDAGVPLRDIADVMYSSPAALDAMRDGDLARAAVVMAGWMNENVLDLRNSGIPDDRLRQLSRFGFGVSEIALAMQIVPGLRDELARGQMMDPRQWSQEMHDALRQQGRATHENPALLVAADRNSSAQGPDGVPWSEQYVRLSRNLQRKFGSASRPDELRLSSEHPTLSEEALLPVALPTPPVEQANAHFGAWVAAVILLVAIFVLLLERC